MGCKKYKEATNHKQNAQHTHIQTIPNMKKWKYFCCRLWADINEFFFKIRDFYFLIWNFQKKEQMFSLFGIKCGRVFDPERTTSLFHFARIAGKYLKRLLLSVFCFSHPYNSSQQHQNVCVHIGITRQFHSGRCLMFLVLRLSLSYCYYGNILMHRVFFFSCCPCCYCLSIFFGGQTMVAM